MPILLVALFAAEGAVAYFSPNGLVVSRVLLAVLTLSLRVAAGAAFWRTEGRLLAVATGTALRMMAWSQFALTR
ncbi:hypothetical protein DEDE109153_02245 [Deinococcus deserti]|uniref:Uncharacterized protein n=1 Tax=Deinococcus deserti (strain DSM 17065 / CIP 109153 / LMG 22923 / VCD115) TaxID=546414 RepID=X5HN17_DEIDV|nr:hypothetical protein [Deinococcus deserti]AHX26502.1 hypothetical protein Deide_11201 [Deinococcus deserti VCD115]